MVADLLTATPPLAAHVERLCALLPGLRVTAAHGFLYVTGADLGAAIALLGADRSLLVTRCYSQGEMALVVSVWTPDTFPPVAPTPRPVCLPVSDCPTTRDLWGAVLTAGAYDGPDRRARQRTARDEWFTWCARGVTEWGEK